MPTPCLITHYLLNDPGARGSTERRTCRSAGSSRSRIRGWCASANYEEGVTGRHDAAKILGAVRRGVHRAVGAVAAGRGRCCTRRDRPNKVVQSILEMVRGGIRDLPVELTVFHDAPGDARRRRSCARCGSRCTRLAARRRPSGIASCARRCEQGGFDYVVLFESSGMYNGEDIASLASHLTLGRLDAVWGSRRLSVRDIQESYRLRYRHRTLSGRDQLRRQPRAEPAVSRAVRPLRLRHAVGGAGRARRGRAARSPCR